MFGQKDIVIKVFFILNVSKIIINNNTSTFTWLISGVYDMVD